MRSEPKIAAFVGGRLEVQPSDSGSREVILALPISRLLVKVVRVPVDQDPVAFATPLMKALSPFPDEPLAVSCEKVNVSDDGADYIVAALPEGSADDVGEALDAAKLNVLKIDALELGALRGFWSEMAVEDGRRRLVVLRLADCVTMIVLDGDRPVSLRAVSPEANFARERMLLLLEAEDFGGPRELAETIEREVDVVRALAGVKDRADDPSTLDASPESWREVLDEERFKSRMIRNLAVAGAIWLLAVASFFVVPVVYGRMTKAKKAESSTHMAEYTRVSDMRNKTRLVQEYTFHDRSALEIMRLVSECMPEGITLSSWRFTFGKSLVLRGTANSRAAALGFVDRLRDLTFPESGETVFPVVANGDLTGKDDTLKFNIDCRAADEEEE